MAWLVSIVFISCPSPQVQCIRVYGNHYTISLYRPGRKYQSMYTLPQGNPFLSEDKNAFEASPSATYWKQPMEKKGRIFINTEYKAHRNYHFNWASTCNCLPMYSNRFIVYLYTFQHSAISGLGGVCLNMGKGS